MDTSLSFRFEEYNPRRAFRGAPAARVWVDYHDGTGEDWLWMDAKDIQKNIKKFGAHPDLLKALDAYGVKHSETV